MSATPTWEMQNKLKYSSFPFFRTPETCFLTRADTLILPNSAIRAGMLSTRVPSLSGRGKIDSDQPIKISVAHLLIAARILFTSNGTRTHFLKQLIFQFLTIIDISNVSFQFFSFWRDLFFISDSNEDK